MEIESILLQKEAELIEVKAEEYINELPLLYPEEYAKTTKESNQNHPQ